MCANFKGPRSHDREMTHKKDIKNGVFFKVHNVGAYKSFMKTEFGGARLRKQYLNCSLASPHRKLASPHRDLASPHRDLGVPPINI